MGETKATMGLPVDLASVLRDQSVVVPQDAAVFELIAAWAKAPTPTASAAFRISPDRGLLDAVLRQSQMASSTPPAGCY
jgi:hypothetical protein